MSAELAHQKADKHLCVALHRKVRISYTLLLNLIVASDCRNGESIKCLTLHKNKSPAPLFETSDCNDSFEDEDL